MAAFKAGGVKSAFWKDPSGCCEVGGLRDKTKETREEAGAGPGKRQAMQVEDRGGHLLSPRSLALLGLDLGP